MTLTLQRLYQTLSYSSDTGLFTRLIAANGRVKIGEYAGCPDVNGYIIIKIDRKSFKAHRLAWLYMTGDWPNDIIDHANGIPGDNRWHNLRQADFSENNANSRIYKNNTTGMKGVSFHKRDQKFYAAIRKSKKTYHLGVFDDPTAAHEAYCAAARRMHGQFARAR